MTIPDSPSADGSSPLAAEPARKQARLPDMRQFLLDSEALLTSDEAHWLYDVGAQLPPGAVVEIGSYKGGSAVLLALGNPGSRVYAIDPHRGVKPEHLPTFDAFIRNLNRYGVRERVEPLVMTSQAAAVGWERPVSFLWIDGNHRIRAVRTDFLLWEPHVVPGGMIALHDSRDAQGIVPCINYAPRGLRGPVSVVRDLILPNPNYELAGTVDSITYFRRR